MTAKKTLVALGLALAAGLAAVAPAQAADAPAPAPVKVEVNAGYADDLYDYNGTIVVPTVYVKFLVEGKVFISKQGSALQAMASGGNANSVKASARYKLEGFDKALAQSIAKQAQDDFVKRMREAGFTVLTYDDIKDRELMKDVARVEAKDMDATWGLPTESAPGSSDTYVVAAPSDAQQFKIGFTGPYAEFMKRGKSRFEDAVVMIPTYTIVAPQVWGQADSGYNRISAAINTAPGMNLQYASATWLGKPHVRMGGKVTGVVTKTYTTNITEKAGEMVKTEETTPKAANAISKGLSFLTGAGSIQASSANYVLKVDQAAYAAGALNGIGAFNAEVGKYAATAKK